MLALMAVCSYVVPIAGFVGVLVGTLVLRFYRSAAHVDDFSSLQLPEFDLHQRMQSGFRQTGLRAVLGNSDVPTRSRMRAMVALQHVSGRISSPLLRNVLNDSSEDLRLLAYGMLDSLERNISRSIDQELDTLRKAQASEGNEKLGPIGLQAAEKLSALYWEPGVPKPRARRYARPRNSRVTALLRTGSGPAPEPRPAHLAPRPPAACPGTQRRGGAVV